MAVARTDYLNLREYFRDKWLAVHETLLGSAWERRAVAAADRRSGPVMGRSQPPSSTEFTSGKTGVERYAPRTDRANRVCLLIRSATRWVRRRRGWIEQRSGRSKNGGRGGI